MCVKIKKNNQIIEYDVDQPLELQLCNSEEIIVNYKSSKDFEVDQFLDEIEKVAKSGKIKTSDIKLINNTNLATKRTQKRLEKIQKHFQVNELVSNLALSHYESDRKLSEISDLMKDRKSYAKKTA